MTLESQLARLRIRAVRILPTLSLALLCQIDPTILSLVSPPTIRVSQIPPSESSRDREKKEKMQATRICPPTRSSVVVHTANQPAAATRWWWSFPDNS